MYQRLSKGQSLADVAVLYYQNLEALFDLAVKNNLPFDAEAGMAMDVYLPEVTLPNKPFIQEQNFENPFVKVSANQALVDIAIQEGGTVEALFDAAIRNGIDITDDLLPGTLLRKPERINKTVAALFTGRIKPASNAPNDLPEQPEGIDYWYIENTFIVS